MIAVIQCAASKRADAGRLVALNGKPVEFVACPNKAPPRTDLVYARPDDLREDGESWRLLLRRYNETSKHNPLNLYRAFELYTHPTYRRLVERFGVNNVYILSAGWGLIRSDFLTPHYDVTFNASAAVYMRRKDTDDYQDFQMLPDGTKEEVVFFGSVGYLKMFCSLTAAVLGKRIAFFVSKQPPNVSGCTLKRFEQATRTTNWQYDCANAFMSGIVQL